MYSKQSVGTHIWPHMSIVRRSVVDKRARYQRSSSGSSPRPRRADEIKVASKKCINNGLPDKQPASNRSPIVTCKCTLIMCKCTLICATVHLLCGSIVFTHVQNEYNLYEMRFRLNINISALAEGLAKTDRFKGECPHYTTMLACCWDEGCFTLSGAWLMGTQHP